MAAPPQAPGQMPPQPYPGMYYQPMALEGQLTRRNLFFANALGLAMIWLAFLLSLVSSDPNILKFDGFLVITGALIASLANVAGALGSKRTTDMQNLGLLIWSGLLLAFAVSIVGGLRFF